MAQLIVRKVPTTIVKKLKARAARHGRSAEAEHRQILQHVLGVSASFKELLASMPDADDDDFPRNRSVNRRKVHL